MKILVVNDDGIRAEGIRRLAKAAKEFGEVWVVAPNNECSAMSQSITIRKEITITQIEDFGIEGVKAYSVSGTPTDCVKVAIEYIMDERPDIVFSGINNGFNAGIDTAYSATVSVAMEALLKGVPAIAFSMEFNGLYEVIDKYLVSIIKEILNEPSSRTEIWNVNFPGCPVKQIKGIKRNVKVAKEMFFADFYELIKESNGTKVVQLAGKPITKVEEGTDIEALMEKNITIQKIRNMILEN